MPPARLYLHILKTYFLSRQRKPFLASYKLTYHCNLKCRQCPFFSLGGVDPGYQQVLQTLDELRARGNRIVIFEGGEPMLWKDGKWTIQDVVLEARKRFDCVGITTNGTLPLDLAANVLWVSIDGLKDTHNCLRGAPIFDQVIANITQSRHARIYAHITANNLNWTEIPELIRQLNGVVKGFTIQFYYPYHHKDELFLDFDRRAVLLSRIKQMKRRGYPIMNSDASLTALQGNTWRCVDWLIDNANPDGSLSQGCYLRGREDIDCKRCGFSPHTEASLAFRGNLQAIRAGMGIFF